MILKNEITFLLTSRNFYSIREGKNHSYEAEFLPPFNSVGQCPVSKPDILKRFPKMELNNLTSLYIKRITWFLCNILQVLGLWKPNKESNWRFYYSSYAIVFIFIFSIIYTVSMVVNIFFLTDFSDLTNRLYMSLTEVALVIKVITFFVNNREWQQILTDIKQFSINSLGDERIIKQRALIFQVVLYVYFFFPNCAAHALGIAPLLSGRTEQVFR